MIGRYRLIRPLGRGGMGEVHLASWQGAAGFERLVALKILGQRFADDKRRLARLVREAQLGVQLDHEHIVGILDLDVADGQYYVAMEHVRGFNLQQVIAYLAGNGEHLPVAVAVHIVRAVARALDYVHAFAGPTGTKPVGLIHGDVTPSNVLLAADGRIKLSDFGVATLVRESRPGKFAGKVGYTPPELFAGATPAQNWDLYGLGVVLYEALSGRPAFAARDFEERRTYAQVAPRAIRDLRADVSEGLVAVVERAMHFDPERRYSSASALLDALDAAVPRSVQDADDYRSFVARLYDRDDFVRTYGTLPSTGGSSATVDLEPLDDDADSVSAPLVDARTQPLRFGMSPALGVELAREHGGKLAELLSKEIGVEVRPVVFGDYQTLVDCLSFGEVDVAWMPPLAFVEAARRGADCLLKLCRRGQGSYKAALLVRADSPIESAGQLRGRNAAWVDRDSAAGYVFAAALLARELGPLDEALGRQHFHGSYRGVAAALLNRWADVGALFCPTDNTEEAMAAAWAPLLGQNLHDLRPIAFSDPIPSDNIAHRPGMPLEQIDRITQALVGLAGHRSGKHVVRSVFNADGFENVRSSEYDPARQALADLRPVA